VPCGVDDRRIDAFDHVRGAGCSNGPQHLANRFHPKRFGRASKDGSRVSAVPRGRRPALIDASNGTTSPTLCPSLRRVRKQRRFERRPCEQASSAAFERSSGDAEQRSRSSGADCGTRSSRLEHWNHMPAQMNAR